MCQGRKVTVFPRVTKCSRHSREHFVTRGKTNSHFTTVTHRLLFVDSGGKQWTRKKFSKEPIELEREDLYAKEKGQVHQSGKCLSQISCQV